MTNYKRQRKRVDYKYAFICCKSRVGSVKVKRARILDFKEVLLKVSKKDLSSKIRSAVKSLEINKVDVLRFLISINIWFKVSFTINFVSKF